MFNREIENIFGEYLNILEASKPLGSLVGVANASGQPKAGGVNGDWGGSMPKLISLLPMGNWKAYSLKRNRVNTKSGYMSDHYIGNTTAYAADFGLNTTFNGNVEAGTKFAIDVARNTGAKIDSWKPYEGKDFKYYTPDGFRIQIIWLSNVGGNHYDHVHLGVARSSNKPIEIQTPTNQEEPSSTNPQNDGNQAPPESPWWDQATQGVGTALNDLSIDGARKALGGILSTAWGAIANSPAGKNLKNII